MELAHEPLDGASQHGVRDGGVSLKGRDVRKFGQEVVFLGDGVRDGGLGELVVQVSVQDPCRVIVGRDRVVMVVGGGRNVLGFQIWKDTRLLNIGFSLNLWL